MKSLAIKGGLGLLGAGGLTVGGYYGLQALNNTEVKEEKIKVKDILEKEGYVLLTKENGHISKVLQNYKTAITPNKAFGFQNFNGLKIGDKSPEDILIEKCNSILEKENNSSADELKKVRKWCVEPITVSALLKKKNINALKTGDADDGDNAKWEAKITKYRSEESNGKPKINELNLSDYSESTKVQKIKDIKAQCAKINNKNNHEEGFEKDIELFKLWCADN